MPIHIIHSMRNKKLEPRINIYGTSPLDNPFTLYPNQHPENEVVASQEEAVAKYEEWLYDIIDAGENEEVLEALQEIIDLAEQGNVYLVGWQKDEITPYDTDNEHCHGDVIRHVVDSIIDGTWV